MLRARFVARIVSGSLIVLGAGTVSGQTYPNKSIRIVTGNAGGGSDFMSRIVAEGISGPLGQAVIVDNRPSGIIPVDIVSKSLPDGYTLLLSGSNFWIGPLLQEMPYDVIKDFSPISQLSTEVNVLVVHPSLPVRSVKELIALAKAKPGELTIGSVGVGSVPHLAGELFKSMAGVNILRIPFSSSSMRIAALLSGEVQLTVYDTGLVAPHVKSGKLRALAVTSATPSALAPRLPTVAASGLPGYEAVSMTGIFARGKTPGTIINRLNQEVVRVINLADVKERFLSAGAEVVGSSPEQFAGTLKFEIAKWGKVIKDAGIKPD